MMRAGVGTQRVAGKTVFSLDEGTKVGYVVSLLAYSIHFLCNLLVVVVEVVFVEYTTIHSNINIVEVVVYDFDYFRDVTVFEPPKTH